MNGERGHKMFWALQGAGHNVVGVPDMDVNAATFIKSMRDWDTDLFVVAGYPRIFKKELLGVPKLGTWNCHAGPVPEYRGGSPLNWQIIDGKEDITISLLRMDEGIDTGPVIDTRTFYLGKDETIKDAHDYANTMFTHMVLAALRFGAIKVFPQPKSMAYRKQRSDNDGEINMAWSVERIHNFVRALTHPYQGAWLIRNGKKIRVWSTSTE